MHIFNIFHILCFFLLWHSCFFHLQHEVMHSRLTSTALKRSSSSSSGGIGSFAPAVCLWGPVDPGPDGLPSFPWETSRLPAAFPMTVNPIDPKSTHMHKTQKAVTARVSKRIKWGSIWSSKVRLCVACGLPLSPQLLCVGLHSLLVSFQFSDKQKNEIHPSLWMTAQTWLRS